MLRLDFGLSRVLVVVGLGLLSLQGPVRAQIAAHGDFDGRPGVVRGDGAIVEVTTPEVAATIIVGRAVGPDGAPAVGAVVVTSAGGQAVTDAEGAFSLEVEVPAGVESVRVTAVLGTGTGSWVASSQVGGLALWGTTSAGMIVLEEAGTCEPSWLPTFGGEPGTNGGVSGFTVFDDGSGPALYAGGYFTDAGGVPAHYIAKWNGSSWSALGSELDNAVSALAVFDDGSGPALYAGGYFTTAGGVPANAIAKWNGTSWSALGSGMGGTYPYYLYVSALTVFDDGSGPALYAGGSFITAGGVAASNLAKWDGSSWSALGSGTDGFVNALTVFDDGSGPALYAGGQFTIAGGAPANFIAKWNGASWSGVGSGVTGGHFLPTSVKALTVYDDGSGPALYAGGWFAQAGSVHANSIAKWNGTAWSALGSGMNNPVFALTVFDDGSGPGLYASGQLTTAGGKPANTIAKWNGSSWSALRSGLKMINNSPVGLALTVFDDGSGPALIAGGDFDIAGDMPANNVAKWNGTTWSALTSGVPSTVFALTVFDDGSGPALYAGGSFVGAGGVLSTGIAKWNGTTWSALASGLGGFGPQYGAPVVYALTVFDDGSGPELYVGGEFTLAGGVEAHYIAKWDGTNWSDVGGGLFGYDAHSVRALTVFDDGSGPALYAGGQFDSAGGVPASEIAKWNGTTWSALGGGIGGGYGTTVFALSVFDDGSGPALYAGGFFFYAGDVEVKNIAKWNGSSWSAPGIGVSDWVYALTVFDDGSGPGLYAGGWAWDAVFTPLPYIAKWNGATWSALGSGLGGFGGASVQALTVFDDGTGPALYAGGYFSTAGGAPANDIARWNGSDWSALGSGLASGNGIGFALAVFDDGTGPALYAGSSFATVPDSGDSYLAKWGGCSVTLSPWTSLGSSLAGVSGDPLLEASGTMEAGSQNILDLSNAAPSAVAILFAAPSSLPTPFKGGTVLPDPLFPPTYGMTSASGKIRFRFILPASTPSGAQAWVQWGIADAAAVKGVALSNAVMGVSP